MSAGQAKPTPVAQRLFHLAGAMFGLIGAAPVVTEFRSSGWQDTEVACSAAQKAAARASSVGCYRGYAHQRFDTAARQSIYVTVRDGTRIAVDIFRPVENGAPVSGRLPVIFSYARYWRAYEQTDGTTRTIVGTLRTGDRIFKLDQALGRDPSSNAGGNGLLLANGYILVRAEARGTGASFGVHKGDMSGVEASDARDVIEWVVRQPWSSGSVAMVGFSYLGMSQMLTASAHPKGLVAIFPAMATFDEYRASWAGAGVLRKYGLAWLAREARAQGLQKGVKGSSINPEAQNVPSPGRVDEDQSGTLRDQALAGRSADPDALDPMAYFTRQSPEAGELVRLVSAAMGTKDAAEIMETLYSTPKLSALIARTPGLEEKLHALHFYRDQSDMLVRPQATGPNNLATLAPRIRSSGIAVYDWGGWRDFATLDTLLWDANLKAPKKLMMGPWAHGPNDPDDRRERASATLLPIEQLRWADYWLKNIDNGIMREPAVTIGVWEESDAFSWLTSPRWPLRETRPQKWELSADGRMVRDTPRPGERRFTVDYQSTTGERTRYHGVFGNGPHAFPDLEAHARDGAVAYTSAPLESALLVAGAPIVDLSVTASTPDATIHAYLERIGADGRITMLTDGVMRASHRRLGAAPYRNLGLPFSDSRKSVVDATPALRRINPARVRFDLQPVAVRFPAGSRLRLVITGADANSNLTIPYSPATELGIRAPASLLSLPIAPGANRSGRGAR